MPSVAPWLAVTPLRPSLFDVSAPSSRTVSSSLGSLRKSTSFLSKSRAVGFRRRYCRSLSGRLPLPRTARAPCCSNSTYSLGDEEDSCSSDRMFHGLVRRVGLSLSGWARTPPPVKRGITDVLKQLLARRHHEDAPCTSGTKDQRTGFSGQVAYLLGFRRAVEQRPRSVVGALWPRADRTVCRVRAALHNYSCHYVLEDGDSSLECSLRIAPGTCSVLRDGSPVPCFVIASGFGENSCVRCGDGAAQNWRRTTKAASDILLLSVPSMFWDFGSLVPRRRGLMLKPYVAAALNGCTFRRVLSRWCKVLRTLRRPCRQLSSATLRRHSVSAVAAQTTIPHLSRLTPRGSSSRFRQRSKTEVLANPGLPTSGQGLLKVDSVRISVTKFFVSSIGVLFLSIQAAGHFSRSVVSTSAG